MISKTSQIDYHFNDISNDILCKELAEELNLPLKDVKMIITNYHMFILDHVKEIGFKPLYIPNIGTIYERINKEKIDKIYARNKKGKFLENKPKP